MKKHAFAALAAGAVLIGAATAAAEPPPTLVPGQLTVGVSMPSEGFQTGAVVGSDVVYARGFEIELARQLRARMGFTTVRFKQALEFTDLFSAGTKTWDIAIAQISTFAARKKTADFSVPYMVADQGVLLSRAVRTAPRNIAQLRTLKLCVERLSSGDAIVRTRVKPRRAARTFKAVQNMMQGLQTGVCDAVVYDAPSLATLRNRVPSRYGGFAGRIVTREAYGIAMPKGSSLLAPVNTALRAMIADGAVNALEKRWLAADLDKLRVLR